MSNDNGRLTIDIVAVINILLSNASDEVRPILQATIAEIKRLRRIETAVKAATAATTAQDKKDAWQALIELCQPSDDRP